MSHLPDLGTYIMNKSTVKTIDQKTKTTMTKVVDGLPTTSAKIRALHGKGYERAEIARFLGKRYQHVRNVLITPVKNQKA